MLARADLRERPDAKPGPPRRAATEEIGAERSPLAYDRDAYRLRGPMIRNELRIGVRSGELVVGRPRTDRTTRTRGEMMSSGGTRKEAMAPSREAETVCPVEALKAWIEAADFTDGPVFRRILNKRSQRVTDGRLAARNVATVVKAAAVRLGLEPATFAGHSLRLRGRAARSTRAKFSQMRTQIRQAQL